MGHNWDMPDTRDSVATHLPGRPQSIDPDSVARTALALFAKHGYGEVSMAQIAEEAGIGRKSLYRYFASKADLVWGGLLEASAISDGAFASAKQEGHDLVGAMHAAAVAAFDSLPDPEVTRGRLRLIADQPELLAQASMRMGKDNERVLRHFSEGGVSAQAAPYLALAFGTVTFAAWISWAQSADPTPEPYLAEAIKVLRLP